MTLPRLKLYISDKERGGKGVHGSGQAFESPHCALVFVVFWPFVFGAHSRTDEAGRIVLSNCVP